MGGASLKIGTGGTAAAAPTATVEPAELCTPLAGDDGGSDESHLGSAPHVASVDLLTAAPSAIRIPFEVLRRYVHVSVHPTIAGPSARKTYPRSVTDAIEPARSYRGGPC